MGRKEQIIEAAKKVFAQKSFFEATVEDIARESGVKKATLYYYFESKLDIFIALIEEALSSISERMMKLDFSEPRGKVVADIIDCYFTLFEEKRDLLVIIQRAGHDFLHHPEAKSKLSALRERFEEYLREVGWKLHPVVTRHGKEFSGADFFKAITFSLIGFFSFSVHTDMEESDVFRELFREVFAASLSE